ncbi:MAG: hypothetical protein E7168_00800 [Firmicutes bacterium]|nr:hypothetical protein [Bacillota bacterium]
MKKRLIGAAIILAIFIPVLAKGELLFALLAAVVGALASKELLDVRFDDKKLPMPLKVLSYLAVALITLNNFTSTQMLIILDYRILSLLLLAFLLPIVIINNQQKYNLEDALYLLGTSIFIGLSFSLIVLVRNYSILYLIYFLLITVMTDTFALFTGMLVGKHQLAKRISPNKTIEGFVGGTLMGVFIPTVFYVTVINPEISLISIVLVTMVLSIVGQLGDLAFSAIKRFYGKKDFSDLIPGHGGVLDRCDSIIFVILTAILFMSII